MIVSARTALPARARRAAVLGLALWLAACGKAPAPPAPAPPPANVPAVPAPAAPATRPAAPPATAPAASTSVGPAGTAPGLALLGELVPPGSSRRLAWRPSTSFDGSAEGTPVLVVNGREPGPLVCLTGAIHGDELNGIEMVRRVLQDLDPGKLRGAVVGIPIVNLEGFRRGSRYLPDRRDLNRYFPGNPDGSAAARIAHSLFTEVLRYCTGGVVDIHTGSLSRTNLPQIRADLRDERTRGFADGFGGLVVLHSPGVPGTLRRAATDAGIPAVTLEAGEPGRLQSVEVRIGVDAVVRLLQRLEMLGKFTLLREPKPVYYRSTWVRSDAGGILFSLVRLGQIVAPGDVLGTVTDPITNEQTLIYSPVRGRVVGMALNQVVMPGYASFHVGIEAPSANGSLVASLEPPPGKRLDDQPDDAATAGGEGEDQERPE